MAKQHRIKHYYKGDRTYRAKPHPVAVVLTAMGVLLLVFVGISIYKPVYNFVMGTIASKSSVAEPVPTPEPNAQSQAEPTPEPAPMLTPEKVRGVFLPMATALDNAALDAFLQTLADTPINTVLVDVKDAAGGVLYNTKNPQALQWGATLAAPLDLEGLSEKLTAKGLRLAVRMHAFRDPLVAATNRDLAIQYRDSNWLWLDAASESGGKPWLNPYAEGARTYVTALALECVELGAQLVVLDSMQFPTGSESNATFGAQSAGVARADILRSFMDSLNSALEGTGARAATYISAITMTQEYENQTRFGGNPLLASGSYVVLGALPYQFGEGFTYGAVSVPQAIAKPDEAVAAALSIFLDEHAASNAGIAYIPLIQGGNEPESNAAAPYTAEQVTAQLGALEARGMEEYILFATDGSYLLR